MESVVTHPPAVWLVSSFTTAQQLTVFLPILALCWLWADGRSECMCGAWCVMYDLPLLERSAFPIVHDGERVELWQ